MVIPRITLATYTPEPRRVTTKPNKPQGYWPNKTKNNPDIDWGNHASTKTTPITTESTMSPEETCQKWKKSTQLRTRRWFRLEGKQTETEPTTPSSPDRLKARGGPSQLCHAATTVPEIGLSHNLNMTHHLTGPLQVISYLISRQ